MNEDLLIQKVVKLESDMIEVKEKLDNCVTKDEYLKGQDQIMKILTKMDTELSSLVAHNKRVDARLDLHDSEILHLKQKVGSF